jgi:hypothetical protein
MTREQESDAIALATAATLRAHVADLLAGGGIPATTRDDLAEELYGHLIERVIAHRADGMTEADAAAWAIAEFGSVDQLSGDLGAVYHSRLWASTIGVLLPAMAVRDQRPGVIGWLRLTLVVAMLLSALRLIVGAWQATPLRALGTGVAGVIGLVVFALAFHAIARGQRWALWCAIAVAADR